MKSLYDEGDKSRILFINDHVGRGDHRSPVVPKAQSGTAMSRMASFNFAEDADAPRASRMLRDGARAIRNRPYKSVLFNAFDTCTKYEKNICGLR